VFRSRLRVSPARAGTCSRSTRELRRTGPILVATILAFFAHEALHLERAAVALAGATAMLLVSLQPLERSLGGIEWSTLFFFVGLFVAVGAVEHTGAIDAVADGIADVTAGDGTRAGRLRRVAAHRRAGDACLARARDRLRREALAGCEPRWASRTSGCSDARRRVRLTAGSAAGSAASRASATPHPPEAPEHHGGDPLTHERHTGAGAREVPRGGSLHSAPAAHCAERGETR
jgi:hypothetical protein